MRGALKFTWTVLFIFFVAAGYKAAFETPESYANHWEDAAAFTFLLLAIVTVVIWPVVGRGGKHD